MSSRKKEDDDELNKARKWGDDKPPDDTNIGGIILFGLIGATTTTIAVTRLRRTVDFNYSEMATQLRKTVDWVYSQFSRSQASWKAKDGGSFRTQYQEEARKRYNRRMQEEYEDEMERVERIRRMQSVFNRARNKYKKSSESWTEEGPGAYHQHFQRNDWYWKGDTSFKDRGTYGGSNHRETPQAAVSYSLSHHYLILGLDRSRTKPYSDDEIKSAFRAKAKEFHPDQNQQNKVAAEAKFKEVMTSYEAIKSERKNTRQ
ncbi:hypothetical protein Leryth_013936 [Lithospermum erythrorhizon]|nr:hypothetical protein Leryth_013936 [Lithospermum erythrorhizon]